MKTIHALAASVALSFSLSARAMTGNELKKICDFLLSENRSAHQFESGQCGGYVRGVLDAYRIAFILNHQPEPYCISNDVTYGQQINIVTRYLNDHPEIRHFDAALLVTTAATDAFPWNRKEPCHP